MKRMIVIAFSLIATLVMGTLQAQAMPGAGFAHKSLKQATRDIAQDGNPAVVEKVGRRHRRFHHRRWRHSRRYRHHRRFRLHRRHRHSRHHSQYRYRLRHRGHRGYYYGYGRYGGYGGYRGFGGGGSYF